MDTRLEYLNSKAKAELEELRLLLGDIYGIKTDQVDQTEPHREVWYLKNPMTSDTIWEGLADIAQDHDLLFEIIERT